MVKVVDNFDAEYEVRLTPEWHVQNIITVVINYSKNLNILCHFSMLQTREVYSPLRQTLSHRATN